MCTLYISLAVIANLVRFIHCQLLTNPILRHRPGPLKPYPITLRDTTQRYFELELMGRVLVLPHATMISVKI